MKTRYFSPVLLAVGTLALVGGCRFPSSGTTYERSQIGRSMSVDAGDIVAVRDVQVSGRTTIVGVYGGGLVGGAAASGGSGVAGAVATAAGAVAGSVVGEATEELATRKRAQEITVKLGNGDTVAVVQEVSKDGTFAVGERVQLLQGRAGTTVRRL